MISILISIIHIIFSCLLTLMSWFSRQRDLTYSLCLTGLCHGFPLYKVIWINKCKSLLNEGMFPCSLIFHSGNVLFCNLVFTLTLPIYLPKVTQDNLTLHYPFLSLILRYHIAYRFLTWPDLTWKRAWKIQKKRHSYYIVLP